MSFFRICYDFFTHIEDMVEINNGLRIDKFACFFLHTFLFHDVCKVKQAK